MKFDRSMLALGLLVGAVTVLPSTLLGASANEKEDDSKSAKVSITGRLNLDTAHYFQEDANIEALNDSGEEGELANGAETRRLRLGAKGKIKNSVKYKFEMEFAGGSIQYKTLALALPDLPIVGTLELGHFKEPFSSEELTSTNDVLFMERSLATTFAPSYNLGLGFSRSLMKDRLTLSGGAFVSSFDDGEGVWEQADNSDRALTARVTFLPWVRNKDDGNGLLYLGLAYSHRQAVEGTLRFRARPEVHFSSVRFVDTGSMESDSNQRIGADASFLFGPILAQGEVDWVRVPLADGTTSQFKAATASLSYVLFGERDFKKEAGKLDCVTPQKSTRWNHKDGKWKAAPGAVELAARWSYLDLYDGNVYAGDLNDFTLGVNWNINQEIRLMANFVHAIRDEGGELTSANIVATRLQVAF